MSYAITNFLAKWLNWNQFVLIGEPSLTNLPARRQIRCYMARAPGLEPGQTVLETVVLPLHYGPLNLAKIAL